MRLLTEQGVPCRAMSRRERPGGVRADFDDPASLARAVADDAHDGQRYDLAGPELLTFADQAAVLERVPERPVKITDVHTLDQLPAGMSAGIGWARSGGAAYVTGNVPRVLGRPAGTFEQWARDHRETLAATP
ncbi:hypothetical protein [Streptomyces rameus]|uniref:hypothetical protein n=1 Tax=Streptomyces rameus TaxID=68261 RepID=UPI0031E704A4